MRLRDDLLKKLQKQYEPLKLIEAKFRGLDLAFKTDKEGNPIVLFIGHKEIDGKIKGERYTRTLLRSADGTSLKDHWDLKGKST